MKKIMTPTQWIWQNYPGEDMGFRKIYEYGKYCAETMRDNALELAAKEAKTKHLLDWDFDKAIIVDAGNQWLCELVEYTVRQLEVWDVI